MIIKHESKWILIIDLIKDLEYCIDEEDVEQHEILSSKGTHLMNNHIFKVKKHSNAGSNINDSCNRFQRTKWFLSKHENLVLCRSDKERKTVIM